MGQMQRVRSGAGAGDPQTLSRFSLSWYRHVFHELGNYLNPDLWGFYGGFMTQAPLIKLLAIGDGLNAQPLSPPREVRGWE